MTEVWVLTTGCVYEQASKLGVDRELALIAGIGWPMWLVLSPIAIVIGLFVLVTEMGNR